MFDLSKKIRPHIADLAPYSSARDEFVGTAEVWLDANEFYLDNGYNRYPNKDLNGLVSKLSTQFGVTKDRMILGNGSDEILDMILRLFCEPSKDSILTMPPTYSMYQVLAKIQNVGIQKVPLDSSFQIDLEGCLAAISNGTKLVMICSPNNPSGNLMAVSVIQKLLEQDVVVVIDEAYIQFADQPSWVEQIDRYPNLIVTQTLSKAYGLAGLRLGLCFANPEIIRLLNKIKPPYNINTASAKAAVELLSNTEQIAQRKADVIRNRERLQAYLLSQSWIEKVYPSDANFLLAKCMDNSELRQFLLENKIVIRDRSKQYGCENCLRFSIGSNNEIDQLINTLNQYQA